jgi:hypothetical protein
MINAALRSIRGPENSPRQARSVTPVSLRGYSASPVPLFINTQARALTPRPATAPRYGLANTSEAPSRPAST